MRRFLFVSLSFLVFLVGCEKDEYDIREEPGVIEEKEILFAISDSVSTKAPTPVTALSSFYVSATTGTNANAQQSKFTNVTFSSNGQGTFSGNKVWPSSDPGYHFYASNVQMTYSATGATVTISTIDTDVVCATKYSSSYNTTNTLQFNHILARVGTVTFQNLGACTNVKLEMKYKAKGTYNLRLDSWSDTGSTFATKQLTTSDNNLWIIPGTYQITLTYTDAGGSSRTKTLDQKFDAGKINNITAKLGDGVIVKTETEFEAPTFTLGTINDIPASGGNSGSPSVTDVAQRKRDKYTYANGNVSYGSYTSVSSPSYTVLYGKTTSSMSSTCPYYSGSNLGTTASARAKKGDIYVRVTANSVSADKSSEVYQEANVQTIGDMTINYSYDAVGPSAGTATPSLSYSQPYSWTSGSKGNYTTGAKVTYSTVEDHSAATLASDGKVTWTQNTGMTRSEKERVTVVLNSKTSTKDATSTQNGDGVSSYENPTVTLTYSSASIAYNSTTPVTPTLVVKQKVNYLSGRSETLTLKSGEYTVTYSAGSVTGLALNTGSGVITPSNNTGTAIEARTEYGTPKITSFSYNNIAYTGGSSSPSVSYEQTKTTYTAGRNSTTSRSISVTATVTANFKSGSSSACTVTQNGDSGVASTSSSSTLTAGAKITYSGSATGFTLGTDGTVTATDNSGSGGVVTYGDPVVTFTCSDTSIGYSGGSRTCNAATYTQKKTTSARSATTSRRLNVGAVISMNGITGTSTKYAYCTQNADSGAKESSADITTGGTVTYTSSGTGFSNVSLTITAASNAGTTYTDYGNPVISAFSYPNVKAAGGTSTPTVTFTQTKTTGRRQTSSREGTMTATVKLNGKTGTKSITFTQAGDSGTADSSEADVSEATVSFATVTETPLVDHSAATLNTATGAVTWSAYTSTTEDRTETERVTVKCNGKTSTKDAVSKQLRKSSWDVDDDDPNQGGGQGGNF